MLQRMKFKENRKSQRDKPVDDVVRSLQLTTEDDDRRRIRRERNKLAAARCRQRRVDLTNQLLAETEGLEDEKLRLEKEISNLQRQRHQLEFVLDSHASRCRHVAPSTAPNHVSQLQATSMTVPPAHAQSHASKNFVTSGAMSAHVKAERSTVDDYSGRARGGLGPSLSGRPNSLSLSVAGNCGAGGLTTSTPMTFVNLGLDCMVDGHTGLTPITGAPSCSANGQRPGDDMASSASLHHSAGMSPTTLMTL